MVINIVNCEQHKKLEISESKREVFRRIDELTRLPIGVSSIGVCYDATKAYEEALSGFVKSMLQSKGEADSNRASAFRQVLKRDFGKEKVEDYHAPKDSRVVRYSGYLIPNVIIKYDFDENLCRKIEEAESLGYKFATLYISERNRLFCENFDIDVRPDIFFINCSKGVFWQGNPSEFCKYKQEKIQKKCNLIYNSLNPILFS